MENRFLREVLPSDLPAVRDYRQEFIHHGGSMDGTSRLRNYEHLNDQTITQRYWISLR